MISFLLFYPVSLSLSEKVYRQYYAREERFLQKHTYLYIHRLMPKQNTMTVSS